jgi:hypothetical protein
MYKNASKLLILRQVACKETFLPICWRTLFDEKSAKVLRKPSFAPVDTKPPSKHKIYSSRIFSRLVRYKRGRFSHTQPLRRGNRRIGGILCIKQIRTLKSA